MDLLLAETYLFNSHIWREKKNLSQLLQMRVWLFRSQNKDGRVFFVKIHVGQQSTATVCLEVFGQRTHDQIVPGCALKPDSTCLNLNAPDLSVELLAPNRASLLRGDDGKVEQRAESESLTYRSCDIRGGRETCRCLCVCQTRTRAHTGVLCVTQSYASWMNHFDTPLPFMTIRVENAQITVSLHEPVYLYTHIRRIAFEVKSGQCQSWHNKHFL